MRAEPSGDWVNLGALLMPLSHDVVAARNLGSIVLVVHHPSAKLSAALRTRGLLVRPGQSHVFAVSCAEAAKLLRDDPVSRRWALTPHVGETIKILLIAHDNQSLLVTLDFEGESFKVRTEPDMYLVR